MIDRTRATPWMRVAAGVDRRESFGVSFIVHTETLPRSAAIRYDATRFYASFTRHAKARTRAPYGISDRQDGTRTLANRWWSRRN